MKKYLSIVTKDKSIKETMRCIDKYGLGIAFIVEDRKLVGVVTDGDIRRAILSGKNAKTPIEKIANKKPIVIIGTVNEEKILALKNDEQVKERIPINASLKVPVLDKDGFIKDVIFIYGEREGTFSFLKDKPRMHKEVIKKVLIIGGAGYLGSILCRKLLNKGYKVKVLDNLTYGAEGIKELYQNHDFEFINGDIREIPMVMEAIKGVDAVIHLAAIVGDSASSLDPEETIEINYLATKAIVDACKFNQVNKFLFASTCSVYGANTDPDMRLTEDSEVNPVSLYAETKLRSEEGILSIMDENFLPTIFRFATLFGISPRMRFDLVVNLLTAKALREKRITIYQGEQWRPHLNVTDAADACLLWLESPIEKTGGKIFNIGCNEQNYQINKIGEIIRRIIPDVKVTNEEKTGDLRNYNVSFDKISKIFDFQAKKTIEEGILEVKKMIETQNIKEFNHPKYNNQSYLSVGAKSISI